MLKHLLLLNAMNLDLENKLRSSKKELLAYPLAGLLALSAGGCATVGGAAGTGVSLYAGYKAKEHLDRKKAVTEAQVRHAHELLVSNKLKDIAICPPYEEWPYKGYEGWLAFRMGEGNESEIYIMAPDGSNLRRLTFDSYFDGKPSWFIGEYETAYITYYKYDVDNDKGLGLYWREANGKYEERPFPIAWWDKSWTHTERGIKKNKEYESRLLREIRKQFKKK